ncbi:F-box only protein 5 [Armadillidium vulgare]|nr:F-box only protein 5 [Armadillidium vulgare]
MNFSNVTMTSKHFQEGQLRKSASSSSLRGKGRSSLLLCEDSGYSSDSSSASASSSRQKLNNHNASKDSLDIFPTPVNWKRNLRCISTPVNSLGSKCDEPQSPKVSTFSRCNSTPINELRCFKDLKSPGVAPIEGPLLRSKTCPNYSSESSLNLLLNISSSSEYSKTNTSDSVQRKTPSKVSEKSYYLSLRSPLKSPFKLFKKPKSVGDVSDCAFSDPEVKERTVKALFRNKETDKVIISTQKTPPKFGSNILMRMMEDASYLLPKIFSYLADEDLIKVSHVCKQLRHIIHGNTKLKCRKFLFIDKKKEELEKIGKENFKQKCATPSSSEFAVSTPRKHFQQLQNSVTFSPQKQQPSPSKPLTRFDKFVKEGKKLLPGESQTKCAHCQNPARITVSDSKAVCTDSKCGYIYCTRCLMPIHEKPSDCVSLKPRSRSSVSSSASKLFSKAYKKRLRRL